MRDRKDSARTWQAAGAQGKALMVLRLPSLWLLLGGSRPQPAITQRKAVARMGHTDLTISVPQDCTVLFALASMRAALPTKGS